MAWFITSVVGEDSKGYRATDSRCFGFYSNYWKAKEAIENNRGNMCECLYDYLVLEYIEEGIHATTIHEEWYQWSDAMNKWTALEEKPERFRGLTNFAIG